MQGGENKVLSMKVILVGHQRCGKTSICQQYCNKKFKEKYSPTLGADLLKKTIFSNDKLVNLQIWDTSGQQRFNSVMNNYCSSPIYIIVYDCENIQSFNSAKQHIEMIKKFINCPSKWLVANKSNQNEQKISKEQGIQLAKQYGFQFLDVSAKNQYNIDQLFNNATDRAIKNKN